MGKISDAIQQLVEKQLRDHSIVVWYDREQVYKKLVQSDCFQNTKIVIFQGSIFSVRSELEEVLEFVSDKGKLVSKFLPNKRTVVYVPQDRTELKFGLVEIESCGVVLEPGSTVANRNSRLRTVAERIFKTLAPHKVADISKEIDAGRLSLEELDSLCEQTGEFKLIRRVFPDDSITSVVPSFLTSGSYDQAIQEKKALPDLGELVSTELGIKIDSSLTVTDFREALFRQLLILELAILAEPKGNDISILNTEIPTLEIFKARIVAICESLRNSILWAECYVAFATKLETVLSESVKKFHPETLVKVNTLSAIDTLLLNHTESLILSHRIAEARAIIDIRKTSFWSRHIPNLLMRWSILDLASQVLIGTTRVGRELKLAKKSPEGLVEAYTRGLALGNSEERFPWCFLDRFERHLEARFAVFELEIHGKHAALEKVVTFARNSYMDTAGRCADLLLETLAGARFDTGQLRTQDTIFATEVKPKTLEGKTAYLLVDALRYEMGQELIEGLSKEFEINIVPVTAQLPTFTEIGMAALMPGAETGMELMEAGTGKVAIGMVGNVLKDRASRIKHFNSMFTGKMTELKLSALMKPTKKVQIDISQAELILVTSQEIDRRGEEVEDEEEARVFMNEVLDKLRRGIRRLRELEVDKIVVSADHGYLFIADLHDAMRIDTPGGKTTDLHPRVWVGRGGRSDEAFLRVSASEIGLSGTLEIAFPKGVACFKTRGANRGFFHGGVSFQELIIPLITLQSKKVTEFDARQWEVTLCMSKSKITTRFFSVEATYLVSGIFPERTKRVKLQVRSGRLELGCAATAAYGFEEGTQEIILENDRPNSITVMLTDENLSSAKNASDPGTGALEYLVTIKLIDAASSVELATLQNVPVKLSI